MKKIILTIIFLSFYNIIYAQTGVEHQKVSYGIKVGAGLSHMNFNRGFPKPAKNVETSRRAGIIIGGFIEAPIIRNLFVQPEYYFSTAGGEIDSSGTKYFLSYFSLPLLLKYKFSSRMSIVIGPQFDLLIKAHKTENGDKANITHDTEERNIGAVAGIEVVLVKHLSFSIRYIHGLNHVGIGQRSDVKEFKYETVQISADFKF